MSAPDRADASFPSGLVLGLLTGAALVVVLSPEARLRVQALAQQLGLSAPPVDPIAVGRDQVLLAVAPPPDPLGGVPPDPLEAAPPPAPPASAPG